MVSSVGLEFDPIAKVRSPELDVQKEEQDIQVTIWPTIMYCCRKENQDTSFCMCGTWYVKKKKKKRFTELINLWRYQFIPSWPCCTNLFPQPQFNKIKIREWISKTCPRFNENKEKIIKTWPWNTLVGKNCFHLWPHYNFTLIKLYYIFFYFRMSCMRLRTIWFSVHLDFSATVQGC